MRDVRSGVIDSTGGFMKEYVGILMKDEQFEKMFDYM